MPTYQYSCTDCGEPVEAVQKFTDPPLSVCAACGGRLRKVFSPVGIVFKGSGFYRTDSRNGSSLPETKKDKQPSDKGSNGSGEKTDKKSAEPVSTSAKSSSSSEKVALSHVVASG